MRYLPILVDLADRRCVVVGGGVVAARKVETLLGAGACVTVIAEHLCDRLAELAAGESRVRVERRGYAPGDLAGAALAYAATSDPEVQERIARDARAADVWLNAVDEPERCSFVMPAILSRGPLLVAVATGGASPALARRIRDDIARLLGPEYVSALEHLGRLREEYAPGCARQQAFLRLIDDGLLEAMRDDDAGRVASLTRAACAGLERRPPASGEGGR